MRLLVSGDRNYTYPNMVTSLIAGMNPSVVIEGEARGADTFAREAAEALEIPVEKYPAQWDKHGRAAGPIRNKQMLDEGQPDVVVCFHDDFENSRGTKHMASIAQKAGVPTYLITRLGP